ncbi:MAG: hypothetical protein WBR26_16450 [Candidatus Acidiferrum sp.]
MKSLFIENKQLIMDYEFLRSIVGENMLESARTIMFLGTDDEDVDRDLKRLENTFVREQQSTTGELK